MSFYLVFMTDAEMIDIGVAVFLGLLVVIIVAAVIFARKNRPPGDEEPVIGSLNTLAAMTVKPPERSFWEQTTYRTTIHCPRCKAYLGDSVQTMRHWCEHCRIYIGPPKR